LRSARGGGGAGHRSRASRDTPGGGGGGTPKAAAHSGGGGGPPTLGRAGYLPCRGGPGGADRKENPHGRGCGQEASRGTQVIPAGFPAEFCRDRGPTPGPRAGGWRGKKPLCPRGLPSSGGVSVGFPGASQASGGPKPGAGDNTLGGGRGAPRYFFRPGRSSWRGRDVARPAAVPRSSSPAFRGPRGQKKRLQAPLDPRGPLA